MTEPDPNRPGSAAAIVASTLVQSPVPPSPRPSVASRTSRSSLQRERQEAQAAESSASPQPPAPAESVEPAEPAFSPLFTLLSSTQHPAQRMTTHHPVMHYIFADDDPEILTDALNHHHRAVEEGANDPDGAYGHERGLVLDVSPNNEGGFEVSWASSLSPDWAVVDARVTPMEGEGGAPSAGRNSPPGALMLRVEGVTVGPTSTANLSKAPTPDGDTQSSSASGAKLPRKDDYATLIEDFEKRMGVLRRVLDAAEARQRMPLEDNQEFGPSTAPIGPEVEEEGDASRQASAD